MSYADGSGGPITLRTSPLASELPLTCQALPFAGGPSGPYLSGCARQLLTVRCAHYAGGASLSTFGFVTIVPRYLPKASNSLTFVRGADRAYCVPHTWYCGLICAPRKWLCRPTDALPVLVVRTPPGGALACAPGSGTLPPFAALAALVVRRVSDLAALFVRRVKGLGEPAKALPVPAAAQPRRA